MKTNSNKLQLMLLSLVAILAVCLIAVGAIIILRPFEISQNSSSPAYSNPTQPPQNPTTAKTAETTVILNCPECLTEGIQINLWDSPDREGVVGSVPHGTRATILNTAYSSVDVLHYKVEANGITGWVSDLFVQK